MFNTKGNGAVWVLIIIALVGLVWWLAGSRGETIDTATTTMPTSTDQVATDTASLGSDIVGEVTVTYTDAGFSPATVTINKGQTVRWVNQSGGPMWVATALHPTHEVYPGSDIDKCGSGADIFDQCANTDSYVFTFNEIGEWGYHNHVQAGKFGKVIVQ